LTLFCCGDAGALLIRFAAVNSIAMGVGMMLASLAALGWGVWKFALHGRLIQ
jgi:hypothetical protein